MKMNPRLQAILFLTAFSTMSWGQSVDHAGLIRQWGPESLSRGKTIYSNVCFACHGIDGKTPTNPMARSFATAPMVNGADPLSLFKTLTSGFNTMPAVVFLSPAERYDVIHYIREAFLKNDNPSQYTELTAAYLDALPKGESGSEQPQGPQPRDFGPVLGSQLGSKVNNGLTFHLPHDIGFNYDLHRMQSGGVWTGGFLNLAETHHYKQRGERMPQPGGRLLTGLQTYGWMLGDTFEIPTDAKPPRGPVRSDWLTYHGYYLYGPSAILSYAIRGRNILEMPGADQSPELLTVHHTFHVNPGNAVTLVVGQLEAEGAFSGLVPLGQAAPVGRSGPADAHLAVISGKSRPQKNAGPTSVRFRNTPLHLLRGDEAQKLDLGTPDRTLVVRFNTTGGGTLLASAPEKGEWVPNGKTLFIRDGRLVYDIGWVGEMRSKSAVADGRWHTAVLTVDPKETRLYVDGQLEATHKNFLREPQQQHVLKIGATATNFAGDFQGELAQISIYEGAWPAGQIAALKTGADEPVPPAALWSWKPGLKDQKPPASKPASADARQLVLAAVTGNTHGLTWEVDAGNRILLKIPADQDPRVFRVLRSSDTGELAVTRFGAYIRYAALAQPLTDPKSLTQGGPKRWPQELAAQGTPGKSVNGYALDTLPVPFENPWNAWLRTSAVDFFEDGRAAVTTHGGDVYVVSGIDDRLQRVTWKRFAAGLFEPFGVRVVKGVIHVTTRDGIKRLHDLNGDGEADFIEAFYIDEDVSSSFHAYNFDLQTDSQGNFYFAKAGQYTQYAKPGTILKVPPTGGSAEIVAWGIRTPNGMGKLADDRFTVSDNQGPWMPAGKISLIRPGAFLGNMPINPEQETWLKSRHSGALPENFDEPFIWTPQNLDNSCGGQAWAADPRWGPLSGRLIHSSFGKGRLYYLSLQETGGTMQASIVTLPHPWEAGVMRLRINPKDGQMYGVGLSGWQGPTGGKDGCFQRLRYTGEPVRMIEQTRVTDKGIELKFNFELDPETAGDPDRWMSEMWNYKWSKQYGSDQYSVREPDRKGHDPVRVQKAELSADRKTVHLFMPDLAVCDQLQMTLRLQDTRSQPFQEVVYFTIHHIPGP